MCEYYYWVCLKMGRSNKCLFIIGFHGHIYIYIILYCLYNPLLHRSSSLIWMYKGWPACKFQPLQFSGNCIDVVFGERNFLICVEEPFWYPDVRYILLLWCSWFTESSSYRCCFHHVVRDMSAATHAQWAGCGAAPGMTNPSWYSTATLMTVAGQLFQTSTFWYIQIF